AIDDAHHTQSKPIRVEGTAPIGDGIAFPTWFFDLQAKLQLTEQWGPPEENAQALLREYARWHANTYCEGKPPPSVLTLINYAGRSSINDAAARAGGNRGTAHYEGYKGQTNWCTQTNTRGVLDGLSVLGLEPAFAPKDLAQWIVHVQQTNPGGQSMVIGPTAAYTAPLQPGDLAMYLTDGSQYGGH